MDQLEERLTGLKINVEFNERCRRLQEAKSAIYLAHITGGCAYVKVAQEDRSVLRQYIQQLGPPTTLVVMS